MAHAFGLFIIEFVAFKEIDNIWSRTINVLTSPLIDFHISKNNLSWFLYILRGSHFSNQGSRLAWSSHSWLILVQQSCDSAGSILLEQPSHRSHSMFTSTNVWEQWHSNTSSLNSTTEPVLYSNLPIDFYLVNNLWLLFYYWETHQIISKKTLMSATRVLATLRTKQSLRCRASKFPWMEKRLSVACTLNWFWVLHNKFFYDWTMQALNLDLKSETPLSM